MSHSNLIGTPAEGSAARIPCSTVENGDALRYGRMRSASNEGRGAPLLQVYFHSTPLIAPSVRLSIPPRKLFSILHRKSYSRWRPQTRSSSRRHARTQKPRQVPFLPHPFNQPIPRPSLHCYSPPCLVCSLRDRSATFSPAHTRQQRTFAGGEGGRGVPVQCWAGASCRGLPRSD